MLRPRNFGVVVALWAVGLSPTAGCSSGDFELPGAKGPARLEIVNGSPSLRSAVVSLYRPSVERIKCSGTLIAPRVVLTAAHCLDLEVPIDDLVEVYFGATAGANGQTRGVNRAEVHPDWEPEFDEYDYGLIELDSDAPSDIVPVPILPAHLGLTEADLGQTIVFAGFGLTEDGDTGTRLEFEGSIDDICLGDCGFEGPDTFTYDHRSGGPCSGDSGGPAFMQRNGSWYVAGINSQVEDVTNNCEAATYGVEQTVDAAADLIEAFIAGENFGPSMTAPRDEPPPGASAMGDACAGDADCDGGDCWDEASFSHIAGGYCTQACLNDADCGEHGLCQNRDCYRTCRRNSDCRDGYACWPDGRDSGGGLCWLACETEADCDGSVCNRYGLCGDTEPPRTDPEVSKIKNDPDDGGCSALAPASLAWIAIVLLVFKRRRSDMPELLAPNLAGASTILNGS